MTGITGIVRRLLNRDTDTRPSKGEAIDALVGAAIAVLDLPDLTPIERMKAEEAYDRVEALREAEEKGRGI